MKALVIGVFVLFGALHLHAADVNVAAASDLNFAIKEIIHDFEENTGHNVRLTLGSSGNFFAQIKNGAPFDVFLSADVEYPKRLETEGYAVAGATFVYGVGRIALWVPTSSPLDLEKFGMNVVAQPRTRKIAIANPEHAPYGRAAVAAMQHAHVYEAASTKLALGENISQAAQFVQSGAADLGIIAMSLVLSDAMRLSGRYWLIPPDWYPKLEQGAALLKHAGPAGKAFHTWLRQPHAKSVLNKYGFTE
ncbi:MAG TPA: molybdate ABC transporter substrate-binding protein [Pyrinomonadaceae bacterium]|nr:molybdate ABC transporter substrate-binding protein [Pyrinomonadaceae bacterium]